MLKNGMLSLESRRRLYLASIALGLPGVLLAWWLRQDADPVSALAFPILAVHLLLSAALLLRGVSRLLLVERTTFGLVTAVGIVRFAFVALDPASEGVVAAWQAVEGPPSFLLILIVIFGYIVLPTRFALRAAAAVVAVTLGTGLIAFGPAARSGESEPLFEFLNFEVYLVVTAAFVHVLASSKDAFARASRDAARFEQEALSDGLTGLPNRRALQQELARRFAESERYGHPLAIVSFDLDHFKRINDRFGHATGDTLLRTVERTLGPSLRAGDTLGRWGGEEFLIIAPETDLDAARALALRCRAELAASRFTQGIRVTASFGVTVRTAGDGVDELLARADELLYQAKREGRDRVRAAASTPVHPPHGD